jgi:ribosome maturation factor RimP
VNKPLKSLEHFRRVVGSKVRVCARVVGGAGKKTWIGRLEEVDDAGIRVVDETGAATGIAFDEIEKANLEFEFEQKPARPKKRR